MIHFRLTKQRSIWVSSILIVFFAIMTVVLLLSPFREIFSSTERFREIIDGFGLYAPLALLAAHVIQVVVALIPGQVIELADGYFFGFWAGSALAMIGTVLGTFTAIGLARYFGRPVVERLLTPAGLNRVRSFIRPRNEGLFFFLFLLPGTPDDALALAIGLTSIPFRRAVIITLLGRTPGVLAAVLVGATGHTLDPVRFTLGAIGLSIVVWMVIRFTRLRKKLQLPG